MRTHERKTSTGLGARWYDYLALPSVVYLAFTSHSFALLTAAIAVGALLHARWVTFRQQTTAEHLTQIFMTHPTHTEPRREHLKEALDLIPAVTYEYAHPLREALHRHYVMTPGDSESGWNLVHISQFENSDDLES